MKNAHLRFGKLVYVRRSEKTATNIRVHLDAFVGEERAKAHLVSAAGGDTEIGALAAAFANGDLFTVIDPFGKESLVSLGERPLCFRGSIMIPGRKRPLRHLVSCSQELADAQCDGKLLLVSDDEMFIWSSLAGHYGLPATPEWRPWMLEQLRRERRIQPLSRLRIRGCCGQGHPEISLGIGSQRSPQQTVGIFDAERTRGVARQSTQEV